MKQKTLIIDPSTSLLFLLFYSPKPRTQVRILIYRKWSIYLAYNNYEEHTAHSRFNAALLQQCTLGTNTICTIGYLINYTYQQLNF